MNITDALEALRVEGMDDGHDHVIETVLSKLFVRGEHVHKSYKHRVADFADLTDQDTRKGYISEDFHWNNTMAPEIYLELRHVRRENDRFVHVPVEHADDCYILMKKIDTSRDLHTMLEQKKLDDAALAEYVHVLTERLEKLTTKYRPGLEDFFNAGISHVKSEVLATCEWVRTATELISEEDIDRAEALFRHVLETEEYFKNINELSVVIDANGENILFTDGGVSFIDIMPPKDAWRVHDRYFIICRTSADISARGDREDAEILHHTYAQHAALPPHAVRMVYEIASALIQVPYRQMIGRDDIARVYAQFVRERTRDLTELIRK